MNQWPTTDKWISDGELFAFWNLEKWLTGSDSFWLSSLTTSAQSLSQEILAHIWINLHPRRHKSTLPSPSPLIHPLSNWADFHSPSPKRKQNKVTKKVKRENKTKKTNKKCHMLKFSQKSPWLCIRRHTCPHLRCNVIVIKYCMASIHDMWLWVCSSISCCIYVVCPLYSGRRWKEKSAKYRTKSSYEQHHRQFM